MDDVLTRRAGEPGTWHRPLRDSGGYNPASEEHVLTAEGIARCTGSQEDIPNLVIAVKWLARQPERAARSSDPGVHRVSFTAGQLAAALSLESAPSCS